MTDHCPRQLIPCIAMQVSLFFSLEKGLNWVRYMIIVTVISWNHHFSIISHNSLPGLIIPDYHIHLCPILLFSSPHISLVHLIIPCEVLYVVPLHFWAFPMLSLFLVRDLCPCPALDLSVCFHCLPVYVLCLYSDSDYDFDLR